MMISFKKPWQESLNPLVCSRPQCPLAAVSDVFFTIRGGRHEDSSGAHDKDHIFERLWHRLYFALTVSL